ncbi:MAG: hypothetical protein AW07_03855 [Candidatus Accumulibacter sp. SK-11]|nr:MAG: hypothetical protein AW07_03855 [Candidatus Accumulibacter sp. SK-11]
MSACTTSRTSGLSIPMPKALVAAITRSSPRRNDSWTFFRLSGGSLAWKCAAAIPFCRRNAATSSLLPRVAQ